MNYGIFSLIPPILAILLAFYTKNVLVSLIMAVFVGATMISGSPLTGFANIFKDYMIPKMSDSWNAGVIAMTLFVGAFSVMLERGGGAWAFGEAVKDKIRTRKQGQIGAWIGGLIIWFSDSSNSVIVGPIMRSVTDRLRISREKLAYICASTAGSVPLLIPITGWGALVMGIYKDFLPEGTNLFDVFVKTIPFNVYTIGVIFTVPLIALTGWEFGPMRKAELRTIKTGKVNIDGAHVAASEEFVLKDGAKPTAWGLVIPIIVLICTLFATMYYTGPKEEGFLNAIFNSETMVSLTVAFFTATCAGLLIAVKDNVITFKEAYQVFVDGFARMIEAIVILIFAWCIGGVTSDVGAADFIVEATSGFMTPGIMFISLFLIACFTSFATGSSWGTFAIFVPIATTLALSNNVVVYPAIGAALAGALFGDHCSPISDSTILASLGAQSDHLSFVKAQMPIAFMIAAASVVGYIVAAVTLNGFAAMGTTLICIVIFIYILHTIDVKKDSKEHVEN